jgi:hypothetical protein
MAVYIRSPVQFLVRRLAVMADPSEELSGRLCLSCSSLSQASHQVLSQGCQTMSCDYML